MAKLLPALWLVCAGCHFDVDGLDLTASTVDGAGNDALGAGDDLSLSDLSVPDLAAADLLPPPPDQARNTGPSTDVAENVLATWTVGESTNDVPVPCNPTSMGNVTLAAETSNVHTPTQAVHVSYTQSSYFQASYPVGLNASWDLSGRTGLEVWIQAVLPAGFTWSPAGPTLYLCGPGGAYRSLSPTLDQLGATSGGYTRLQIPLAGDLSWLKVDNLGFDLTRVSGFELHFDPLRGLAAAGTTNVYIDDAFFY